MQKNIDVDSNRFREYIPAMETTKNTKFWHEQKCAICETSFWSLIKRNQKTCSAKCSGIYVAKNPNRVAKIKQTKLEKYGSETYVNSDKAKKTCLSRYGVDNVSKSNEIREKIKKSNQEKYGVDWSFQSGEIKDKIKEKNLTTFGVEHVSQRPDVKNKKVDTYMRTLGVENPFQSDVIKNKIKKQNLIKYGVEHHSQSKVTKEKIRNKWKCQHFDDFLANHKLNNVCVPLFSKDEYINTDREHIYKFSCKVCGNVFEDHIDGGHLPRCVSCFPLQLVGESQVEKEILEFVKSITTDEVLENSREVLPSKQELDMYIPSKKLAIEFDGLYWHSDLAGKPKNYHLSKTNECESIGIHLIHIFEDEWKNKRSIVEEKIKSKLISTKRVGARQLNVRAISAKEKSEFLTKHHIQGDAVSSINYGAFYNETLVAVITFAKERIALGKKKQLNGVYELVRYATSIPIVGAIEKMIKVFRLEHTPTKLISYADRRFTSVNNNIYKSIGMTLTSISKPNYWYFNNGYYNRHHRFGYRKQVLSKRLKDFDPMLSEWQNMKNNGFNRIWDCGNLRYEMNFI